MNLRAAALYQADPFAEEKLRAADLEGPIILWWRRDAVATNRVWITVAKKEREHRFGTLEPPLPFFFGSGDLNIREVDDLFDSCEI